ncbi:energy transducer TonB [Caulobacter hibisci]|uniref:Energy transducer TonB n=1 Tax=Caulobacter hibisci TaxID=2035993 RepID=A0ABS0T3W0_9CAUL|nr:energy transducer TonB [Caulobacter hibisci]MBI1686514.1 energy transducer TonB [Caulobacter hibisci]
MREDRNNLSPALIGSVALHGLVVAAVMIGWPWKTSKPIVIGESVPVTIVTEGPTNVRPAIEDPVEQPAETIEPVPDATPQPPAPIPAPTPQPAPPKPQPTPRPAPAPVPPKPSPTPTPKPVQPQKPTPQNPTPAKPEADFFSSMEKTLSKTAKPAGKPNSSAPQGQTNRAETANQARPGTGAMTALQTAAISGMKDEIQRRWNPNCEVVGGGSMQIKLSFKLAANGRVAGQVTAGGAENSGDTITRTEAERAIRAVFQSAPFEGLPPDYYNQQLTLNFKARDACAAR